MKRILSLVLFVFAFAAIPVQSAYAYIGPGGGLTAIGAILALIAVIVVTFFGFLWYPIKRFRKKLRERKNQQNVDPEP
ncbi:hypothetical protein [Methylophaga sp. OBS4]|uniref:hypothetical protein n=1 Tax=Methylophaga sp. OBS4 TaxID=2991935 RepID=UPI0022530EC6|nr:hypothetical protein [Methylophaga sp. OBS4]MCX4187709.1 hypothetical protein [Methylophaga sp. OBS4]